MINLVDFEKAFDSVHWESLWNVMRCYGIPDKLIRMVQLLYEDTQCAVIDEGEESEWFMQCKDWSEIRVLNVRFSLLIGAGLCNEEDDER